MKTRIIILWVIFLFTINLKAQTECESEYLLQLLTSSNDTERSLAVDLIISCNKTELLADLQNSFLTENELYILQQILDALYQLNVNNIENYAYDFIDKTRTFEKDVLDDEYLSRLFATSILFSIGDYSTYNHVFEYVNNRFDKPSFLAINMLAEVIEHVPVESNEAKIKIEDYVQNSLIADTRTIGLIQLVNHYEDEYTTVCTDKFYNDNSYIVRYTAFRLLMKLNAPNINTILRGRLPNDPDWSIRVSIADTLLLKFGTPSDLKSVIDYQPTEPNETSRSLMSHSIQSFIPPRPNSSANKMIDTLRVYTDQLYQYNWITDYNTYLYYLSLLKQPNYQESILKAAKKNLKNINILLTKVEADLSSGLLTEEGYKFMHYYSIYIKEELQKIIDGSTLRIK